MKKIGNTFSIVGTNPHKYVDNFLLNFINIGKLEMLNIDKQNLIITHNGVEIIAFNSDTTMRQNIDCWVGLGLVIKSENHLIKIINNMNEFNFYEYIRGIVFVQTENNAINTYRDTILIKLMNLIQLETIDKFKLSARSKNISIQDIQKETGVFEKKLIEDKKIVDFLKIIWGDNNG